ncbi:MAG: hypothetical protein RJA99_126 [Pseudomonadota bacterium]
MLHLPSSSQTATPVPVRLVALCSAVALALAACGGGGGSGTEVAAIGTGGTGATAFSGVVVDGPIEGATVFVDLDGDFVQDPEEPQSAPSDASGRFTVDVSKVDPARLKDARLVVHVPDTAKDADDGGKTLAEAGRAGFTLTTTPPAAPTERAVLSPLTTLVTAEMRDQGTSRAEAAAAVALGESQRMARVGRRRGEERGGRAGPGRGGVRRLQRRRLGGLVHHRQHRHVPGADRADVCLDRADDVHRRRHRRHVDELRRVGERRLVGHGRAAMNPRRGSWIRIIVSCVLACGLVAPTVSQPREPVAEVLGRTVHRDELGGNPDRLQPLVIGPLLQRFADENGVKAEPAEVDDVVTWLGVPPVPGGASKEMQAEVRTLAERMVVRWKVNRALYRRYGGTVIFQQSDPLEPVGAMRRFLEEQEASGAFTIREADLRERFYRYFRREHRFVVPPDQVDYERPWWRR